MATGDSEDVYCTLVMNDAYLPGAAVLAHSLRDAGTTKKLACLVLQDGLRDSSLTELRTLYNYVIPIERIGNPNPANLYLMNRPDLLYTFTKIHLWSQTQFRKIVYIDADVVALRAPEELFDIQEPFAAAPDVGWPDAFNTGVMVISPHMGDYHALRGLANAGDSFDGADQGLLNQYYEYRPWKRISFTYNTTPSANYQYEPAYRYFKRDISLVHFIGAEKPWQRGRSADGTPSAFQEMLSRWWAVYDRHFSVSTADYIHGGSNPITHYIKEEKSGHEHHAKESYSATGYPIATTGPAHPPPQQSWTQYHHEQHQKPQYAQGSTTPLMTEPGEYVPTAPIAEQRRFCAPHMEWDATRGAPPIESKPEAANFPTQTYEFNSDPEPFRPPPSYPEPPKDMWYSVPEKPKLEEKVKPIFPWEERESSKPTRRFVEDEPPPPPPPLERDLEPYADELEVFTDSRLEPTTPTIRINDDPWASFAANKNAWDDNAGIEKYVRALTSFQRHQGKVQVLQQEELTRPEPVSSREADVAQTQQHILSPSNEPAPEELIEKVRRRRESLKLTDFPTAIERPSLPVTPAPRRRPTFWGEERDAAGDLPTAEGVPDQVDWDPSLQLEQLRRNSLIGPGELKLHEVLSRREMPSTAVAINEEALAHPHVPIADGADDEVGTKSSVSYAGFSGASSPHGLLDGTVEHSMLGGSHGETRFTSSSTSQQSSETVINTAINSYNFDDQLSAAVSASAVDEMDMKKTETSAGEGWFGSSRTESEVDEEPADRDFPVTLNDS